MGHIAGTETYALYVADISPEADACDLSDFFCPYGDVTKIEVRSGWDYARDPLLRATVIYRRKEDAENAIIDLNGALVKGLPIRVMWFTKDPSLRYGTNVIITNLDKGVMQAQLWLTVRQAGEIRSCKIATDRKGNSLGYAFVSFADDHVADDFITKVNGASIGHSIVRVTKCIPKSQRYRVTESGRFNNCYVKKFGPDLNSDDLKRMFDQFGSVTSAHVMRDEAGRSRRFGFVAFAEPSSAETAVLEMNGKYVNGRHLYVGRAMKRAERDEYILQNSRRQQSFHKGENCINSTVYVKNLDRCVNEAMLKDFFGRCGVITRAWIAIDENGASKGFGFVQFSSVSEALRALELSGRMWHSRTIYVALLQIREERDEMERIKKQFFYQSQQPLVQTPVPIGGRIQLVNQFPPRFVNGTNLNIQSFTPITPSYYLQPIVQS